MLIVDVLISLVAAGVVGSIIYGLTLFNASDIGGVFTGILIGTALAAGTFVYVMGSL